MNEIMVPNTEEWITRVFDDITNRQLSPAAKRQKIKYLAERINNVFLEAIGKERMQRDLALGWIKETPEGYKITELGKQHLTSKDGKTYWAMDK